MHDTAVYKVLRQVIHDIRGMELEAARSLAFEELRTLPLDPRRRDRLLRQISDQRSLAGVVDTLEAFCPPRKCSRLWRFFDQMLGGTCHP